MLNSLLRFIKKTSVEGKRIESNLQSVKEEQIKNDFLHI
jgi:hypothetical protein